MMRTAVHGFYFDNRSCLPMLHSTARHRNTVLVGWRLGDTSIRMAESTSNTLVKLKELQGYCDVR